MQITIDDVAAIKIINDMQNKVFGLQAQMPENFLAWQSEDMNRARPSITAQDQFMVETVIYPRSKRLRPAKHRNAGKSRPQQRRVIVRSTRPILRPELFTMLVDRMRAMLASVKWR